MTDAHLLAPPILALIFVPLIMLLLPTGAQANTECVWATGLVKCNKNQSSVLGAVVELWESDSPQSTKFENPLDPDDLATFTEVDDPSGLWKLDGCGSDRDWFSVNSPEFYLRVYHQCNTANGEWLTVWPVFRVYAPHTYDWHIAHPIVLDMPTMPLLNNNGTPSAAVPVSAVGGRFAATVGNEEDGDGTLGQQEHQQLPFTVRFATPMPVPLSATSNKNSSNNNDTGVDDEDIVSDGTRHNEKK